MQLNREAMNAIVNFDKVDWESQTDEARATVEIRLRTLWEQLPQITSIEGVKNVTGAKALIEKSILATLDKLGAPIDEMSLSTRLVDNFLAIELPIA